MDFVPIATSAGPRRALPPHPPKLVRLTTDELRLFCRVLDAEARAAERAGDFAEADRLATRAAGLRP